MTQQGQREKSVRDGGPQRSGLGAGRIDMDELVIERRLGKSVNARLLDRQPGRGSDHFSGTGTQSVDSQRSYQSLRHARYPLADFRV